MIETMDSNEHARCVDNAQASDHVEVTIVARRPKAIVLLLGWMGAERRQLNEYARIYHTLQCCTVVATAPLFSIVHCNKVELGQVASVACREVARLVRMAEMSEMGYGMVPLLLHVFGNGGALLVEQMHVLIREWVDVGEVVHQQTRVSSCPVPLRSAFKQMESMKSLPSMTGTDSEGEESSMMDDDAATSPEPIWTPPKQLSKLRLMTVSPKRLPLDPSRIQENIAHNNSLKVKRIDMERSAAVSSMPTTPKYNMELRALSLDFSLVASRLGSIVFDSFSVNPCDDLARIVNPATRLIARSAVVGRGLSNLFGRDNNETSGRSSLWESLEQLSLSSRQNYVNSRVDSRLEELIRVQREKGTLVTQQRLEEADRLGAYPKLMEEILDKITKKLPQDEDEEDGWSSDEEDFYSAHEEWHDAQEVETCDAY